MAQFADNHHQTESRGAWRMVVVLSLITTFAFVDRALLSLVVQPIKTTLHLPDVTMSLLFGLTFAVGYCISNFPAGYMADRMDRRLILSVAAICWAIMTMIFGLSSTVTQLFLCRAGVGLAEGVISPVAFSLIRDGIPPARRPLAFSIFSLAPIFGATISLVAGGFLLKAAGAGAFKAWLILSALAPWQATFFMIGVAGIPISLLLLTFPEPPRHRDHIAGKTGSVGKDLAVVWHYLVKHGGLFVPLFIFCSMAATQNFAVSAWLPTAMARTLALEPQDVGPRLGLMTFIGSTLGIVAGGWMMARLSRQGKSVLLVGGGAGLLSALGIAVAFVTPSHAGTWAFVQFGLLFMGISYAAGASTLSRLAPAQLMGRLSAVYVLAQTAAGYALGPLLVPTLARLPFFKHGDLAMGLAASVMLCGVTAFVSGWILQRRIGKTAD